MAKILRVDRLVAFQCRSKLFLKFQRNRKTQRQNSDEGFFSEEKMFQKNAPERQKNESVL